MTFQNHREKNCMLFHIDKYRRPRKSNQKRAQELGMPAEWRHSNACRRNVSQTRKIEKRSKSTKCYISFHDFPESSAKLIMLFHIYKCRRFRISNHKRHHFSNCSRMNENSLAAVIFDFFYFRSQSEKKVLPLSNFSRCWQWLWQEGHLCSYCRLGWIVIFWASLCYMCCFVYDTKAGISWYEALG